jgi:hypothetical protein
MGTTATQTQFAKTIDMLRDELVTGTSPGDKRGAVITTGIGGAVGIEDLLARMEKISRIYSKVSYAVVGPYVESDGRTKVEIQMTGYLVDMLIFCLLCEVAENAD